ncbi:MAG: alanyl-tRNA editing protein AlaX [Candidatus Lokiarchaeota archaeon]|nr:alanyl-tRNA editing protein AlaX [Candidatus Lokiarchaeota archaeon]MBD3201127.1 alanyl-tRNA editing protein AlaX [Candidatus Lokiarchaeota archaeon]
MVLDLSIFHVKIFKLSAINKFMTEVLYLENSYLKNWNAIVTNISEDKYISLDKTAFYPKGGGQPYDKGSIFKGDEEFKVIYVGKFSGKISHEINKKGLKVGDEVSCELDWDRRYTYMRSHTASHMISALMYKKHDALITGNQIGIEKTRIDFSVEEYDPEIFKEIIEEVNGLIKNNISVKTFYITRNRALNDPEMTKLAKGLPKNLEKFRIVKIGEIDQQADAGTHVQNLNEIGELRFIKSSNKGKDNRRLYFKLIE